MLKKIGKLTLGGWSLIQSEGDCALAIHKNPSDFPPSQEYGRDPYYPSVNIFRVVNRIESLETVS